jgi:hypothetical protein
MNPSTETEPPFASFEDVRRLLERRRQLRSDVENLASTRTERATLKSSISAPDPWRACTSGLPTHVGNGFVVREDGGRGRLCTVNALEIDREIGRQREQLGLVDDRLLRMAVLYADRYLPLPPSGLWALTQSDEGMPALVTFEPSTELVDRLFESFASCPRGTILRGSQVQLMHPPHHPLPAEVGRELREILGKHPELWFAVAGETPRAAMPMDDPDDLDDEEVTWGKS